MGTSKKFEDSLETPVFTTTFVIKDKKDITYVTHEIEDGAWQFFSSDSFDNYEDVAMVVGLAEIINLDKTILDIADLPLGCVATRRSASDKWVTKRM
ncbi:MAG TPA: DUF2185 domain-containing protein [Chitinophagaceae bacterium]|nr:DUF2185 domain-containing protein [Chitinophagaceae bacterium]